MADEKTILDFQGQDSIDLGEFANAIRGDSVKAGLKVPQMSDKDVVKTFFKNAVPKNPEVYGKFREMMDANAIHFTGDIGGTAPAPAPTSTTLGPPAGGGFLDKYKTVQQKENTLLGTPVLGALKPSVERVGDWARSGTPASNVAMGVAGAGGAIANPLGAVGGAAALAYDKYKGVKTANMPVAMGQFQTGMAQALAETGIDMSSAHGLGFLALSLAGPGEAKSAGKIALKLLNTYLSGNFGKQSWDDLSSAIPEAGKALDKGDMVGAGRAFGKTLNDLFIIQGSARHVAGTVAGAGWAKDMMRPMAGGATGEVLSKLLPEHVMEDVKFRKQKADLQDKIAEASASPSKAKVIADLERQLIEAQRKSGIIPPELPKPTTPAAPAKAGKAAVKPSAQAAPPAEAPVNEAPHPDEIVNADAVPQPTGPTTLPPGLSTVKPKFSTWRVNFDDDIDRAAYIVAQNVHPQKKALSEFVQNATGLTEAQVKMLGRQVKDQVGRIAKADGEGETELNVPVLDLPQKRKAAPATTPEATPPPLPPPTEEQPPALPSATVPTEPTPVAEEPAKPVATQPTPKEFGVPYAEFHPKTGVLIDSGRFDPASGVKKPAQVPAQSGIPEEIPTETAKTLPGLSIIPSSGKLLVDKDTGEVLTYRGKTGKNKHSFTDQRGNAMSVEISDSAFKQSYGLFLGRTGGATPAPPIDEADVPVPAEKPKLVKVPKVGAVSTPVPKAAPEAAGPSSADAMVKKILDKETEGGRFDRSYPFHVVIEGKDGMPMFIKDFASPDTLAEDTDIMKSWIIGHPDAKSAYMAAVSHSNVGRKGKTPIGDLVKQARKEAPVAKVAPSTQQAPPTDAAATLREAMASEPSEPTKNQTDLGKKLKEALDKGKKKDSGVDKLKSQESGKDIIRGSSEIPLSDQGHQESQALAQKFEQDDPAFTEVHVSPMGRAKQTAAPILDKIPNAQRDVSEHLAPWYNGAREGRPTKEVLPAMQDDIVNNPDRVVEGMGAQSTRPGESFNSFKNRFLGGVRDQLARWQPGQKILNITHYRDVKAMDAWIKNGHPEDMSIDPSEMIKKGDTHPGDLYRLDPQKMTFEKAEDTKQDGIYFARHGSTEWNGENKGGAAIGPTIDQAKVEGGKIKASFDEGFMGQVMAHSLYGNNIDSVVAKELLQNSFDAVRGVPGGHVKASVKGDTITVEDNGPGMTREEVETVFTDVGRSGNKRQQEDASGGFGIAKASFLLGTKSTEVSTVARAGGAKYRTSFTSTPKDLLGKGSFPELKTEAVPDSTPTGTTVKATIQKEGSLYGAESQIENISRHSVNLPGKLTYEDMWGSKTHTPTKHDTIANVEIPGTAKLNIAKVSGQQGQESSYIPVYVQNNGIFQFEKSYYMERKFPGAPRSIKVDIKSLAEEGTQDYPFKADREDVRKDVWVKIADAIKKEVETPLANKYTKSVIDSFTGMKTMHSMPFMDSGARLEPDEVKSLARNPALKNISSTIKSVTEQTHKFLKEHSSSSGLSLDIGKVPVESGLLFQEKVRGSNITSPDLKYRRVLVNPFSFTELGTQTPEAAASLVYHTIKHELLHNAIGGHPEERFPSELANLDQELGFYHPMKMMYALKEAYEHPEDSTRFRDGFDEALRIYAESRTRSERKPDAVVGEASRTGRSTATAANAGGGSTDVQPGGTEPKANGATLGPPGSYVKHLGPVKIQIVTRGASLKPDVAATLAPGSTRMNPDGSLQELKRIPLNKVNVITTRPKSIPQDVWDKRGGKNTMYPETVNKYATNPSSVAVELIEGENGQWGIWDGHHRVEGARQRGDTSIMAWIPVDKPKEGSTLGPPDSSKK